MSEYEGPASIEVAYGGRDRAAVRMVFTCASCRHAHPTITDDDEQPLLKCHRYPPSLFVLDGEVTQAWPDAVEACGEWSP